LVIFIRIDMSARFLSLLWMTIAGAVLVQLAPAQSHGSSKENSILALLESGKAVFGAFSGDKTKENAAKWSADDSLDFVFYDMETGPFDVPGMRDFMESLGSRSIATRLPPIREGREEARERARLLLEAGVDMVVFPHVEDRAQAELAVSSVTSGGRKVPSLLIIEDRNGVANAREIVSTPGVDIVFPGPGDLRRAYEGDAAAIENAIQTVLSACKEFGVVCGITAGPTDIEKRLKEGFRVFIVTDHDALGIGRRAASRGPAG
jgi:2-keto-3-deoxy-L-rhamnonate aldolase RhmA